MSARLDYRRTLAVFVLPYLAAVVSATLVLAVLWQVYSVIAWGRAEELDSFAFGVLFLVFIGVALFALVPTLLVVALTERAGRTPGSLSIAFLGALTGGLIALVFLFVTTSMDFSDQWIWQSVWDRFHFVPASAFAGFVGGGLFAICREKLLQTRKI